jgi:uncharacterized membrane protein YkvA (DUF1232 family)
MKSFSKLREWATVLKQELYAIYLAQKDPRVPWYTKVLAACVVGYAFSPIDLIPDPIPVLGYLDDLILIPLGVALVVKLIPVEVLEECRQRAREVDSQTKPRNWVAGGIIILIWLALAVLVVILLTGALEN